MQNERGSPPIFRPGIDEVLKRVGVPKGSFYHYFERKEAFGAALIERYANYFGYKRERRFNDESNAPLELFARGFFAGLQTA